MHTWTVKILMRWNLYRGNKLPSSTKEREFTVAEKFVSHTTRISNYMKLSECYEIFCESFTMQKMREAKIGWTNKKANKRIKEIG